MWFAVFEPQRQAAGLPNSFSPAIALCPLAVCVLLPLFPPLMLYMQHIGEIATKKNEDSVGSHVFFFRPLLVSIRAFAVRR
jgi:hypothetical protein